MNPVCSWLAAACCAALACGASAGTVVLEGEQVRLGGMLDERDVEQFRALLAANHGVRRAVFDRCIGGTLFAGLEVAGLVRAHRLHTVASRQCSSACAMGFLAGTQRSFDPEAPSTSIVLHAGRRRDGSGPSPEGVNRAILMFLETATDGRLDRRLLELVRTSWSEAAGVAFVRRRQGDLTVDEVRYCDGSQGAEMDRCRRLPSFDPLSQGIITQR